MSSVTATKQKEASSRISCSDVRAKDHLRDEISKKAYELYERNGRENGHDQEHWHIAESHVARKITDISESASWYTFKYPVDGFRLEDTSISVEPEGAAVQAQQLHLTDGKQSPDSLVSRDSLFLIVRWPTEVDVSTASAFVKDCILSVTAKRAHVG
jgi:hypothetical protein